VAESFVCHIVFHLTKDSLRAALCLLRRKKENAPGIGDIDEKKDRQKTSGLCSEIIITIERFPTRTQSVYKPQGDDAPYIKCQRLGNAPTALGMISADKDIKKNISALKKLIKNWSIETPEEFLLVISNAIGAVGNFSYLSRKDLKNDFIVVGSPEKDAIGLDCNL